MTQSKSNSVCPRMWNGLSDRDGESLYPCCRFDYGDAEGVRMVEGSSLTEAYNAPLFRSIREQMLNGVTPSQCHKCVKDEESHIKSERQYAIEESASPAPTSDRARVEEIHHLEVFIGNSCNLRCHTCNPTSSSSWRAEYKSLGWDYSDSGPSLRLADNIGQLVNLRDIKVIGGEPSVGSRFEELLGKVRNKHQVEIHVSTNCTKLFSEPVLSQLREFKRVWISLSIDGPPGVNDIIRYPAKSSDVEATAREYVRLAQVESNFRISMHVTVTLLNLLHLHDLILWWESIAGTARNVRVDLALLHTPENMSLLTLPERLQREMEVRLGGHPLLKGLLSVVAKSQDNFEANRELLEYCRTLDRSRGTSSEELIRYLFE